MQIQNKSHLPNSAPFGGKLKPSFLSYVPDWQRMEKLAAKYSFVKRVLLAGHGGSRNTFAGIYGALRNPHTPEVVFIDSNDPEFLDRALGASDPAKTLLLGISKSGENLSQIEATLFLYDLPHKVFITGPKGTLREISNADPKIDVLDHPDIGGRFAGLSEVGMFPALLCGFDAHGLVSGGQSLGERSEAAWELASVLYELENKGTSAVLVANYAHKIKHFNYLVQQLLQETWGKEGKGLAVIPATGPELQHHTSQLLFGGPRNLAVVFVKYKAPSIKLLVPDFLTSVQFKDRSLADLSGRDLGRALNAEYQGTQSICDEERIPNLTLELPDISTLSIGAYIRFWQMVAIYGAELRGIDPFGQPQVEAGKLRAQEYRFKE